MTLPTTNLSFSGLQTEYGGSNPISMSEYYKGGSFVPSNQSSSYGTIPTSGAISLGVFRGTTKFTGLDFRTVTPGYIAAPKGGVAYYGYQFAGQNGSISPTGNSTLSGHNVPIYHIRASEVVNSTSYLEFYLNDSGNGTNSGFTTMTIANTTTSLSFSRTSATFANSSINSSSISGWQWSTSSAAGNMFMASSTVDVTWT
jgi:hypothetical protein